ncbi:unnamed protein product [Phytomonas sp. Hart1]|nr:unnamed protein product [Phytomonas sp. Hart1]|eukprot:CCW71268.1 unnamed protein product [Phytomonas sp. isolate Hart1]
MRSICEDVQCDKGTSKYQVRVKGATDFVDCPPGSTLVLSKYGTEFNSGAIECPPYEEVCNINYHRSVTHHVPASGTTNIAYHFTYTLVAALAALIVLAE